MTHDGRLADPATPGGEEPTPDDAPGPGRGDGAGAGAPNLVDAGAVVDAPTVVDGAPKGGEDQDLAEVSLMDAFGGRRGVLDSGLPPLTFIGTYLATGNDLRIALLAALGAGVLVTVLRLARHDTVRHALAGFGAVALAAFVASRTGRPQDYFLPSLLANVAAAVAWAVSIWIKRPFLGLTVGALTRSSAWRTDPRMLHAYCRASWIWVASFLVRVAVMTPLWLAGQTVALGLAKVALGWPMVLVVIWLSWQVVEPAHRARREQRAAPAGDATSAAASPVAGRAGGAATGAAAPATATDAPIP